MKSPIAGSIIALQVAPGAYVNDATAAMMTIANLDTVWVTANVPEKDVSFIYPGQSVKVAVTSYPGRAFSGKVLFVSDVIEPDTRRNKVRIEFQNPDKALKPNMFATVTFVAPPVTRITVPNVGAADDQRQDERVRGSRGLGLRAPRCRDRVSGGHDDGPQERTAARRPGGGEGGGPPQ